VEDLEKEEGLLVAEHQGNTKMDRVVTAELRSAASALSWWLYLETSKRVAATYSCSGTNGLTLKTSRSGSSHLTA
jgi:hypothetical protein